MGVHGWTSFLQGEGWLPRSIQSCGCITSLWRDPRSLEGNEAFASRIVKIPEKSEIHIDGYGLAFYIWDIAFERHLRSLLRCSPCSVSVHEAATGGVDLQRLLPITVPLSIVDQVTREYMGELVRRFRIHVYFDGNGRRIIHRESSSKVSKQETTEKRLGAIFDAWDNLRLYCSQGSIPPTKTICRWKREFPRPRLLFDQFRHTLRCMDVTIVECEEEGDFIIAKAASGHANAYVLGNDSDFCFFRDINYIPFSSFAVSTGLVTGCVLRRDILAESLGLEDRDMVELAILCGNDYLVNPATAQLGFCSRDVQECIDHLRSNLQEGDYRIASEDKSTEEVLAFVRVHYDLGDLTPFPLALGGHGQSSDASIVDTTLDGDNVSADCSLMARPVLPSALNLELARVVPGVDTSVKSAVLRCLQEYFHKTNECGNCLLSQEHLDVFRNFHAPSRDEFDSSGWRQEWADNLAFYLITKAVAFSLKSLESVTSKSPLMRLSPPFALFDFYQFHCLLHKGRVALREPPVDDQESNAVDNRVCLTDEPSELPIDEYEDEILKRIRGSRVSIIQAETGAGKSSRVPVMILKAPPPVASLPVKLFISQPRRIAAKALVERLRAVEPRLKNCFALRMGHGVREYESHDTRAWFVTAGYLVRLLANHPERFNEVSHLIIDEVHERSVETDLLCLLCRRLVHSNDRIRLVLMSATMASKLYQDYFGVPEEPLRVGARRFPVEEVFLDDMESRLQLSPKLRRNLKELISMCTTMKCKVTPSPSFMELLYPLVAHVVMVVGKPGSSVLVFVPGMNEIVAMTEAIEQLFVQGVKYSCLPIHSDIPFEDQLDAFQQPAADEVIIIIATNAAESSVTLPAVDCVVCTGLCKQIIYNETSHRQMLTPTWISKASATQRAGRTGRLRPGTVFRLYTRANFLNHMDEFEPGEMSRIPLDNVILMLKGMILDSTATDILLDCLEPPNLSTIDRSFQSLFRSRFITSPNDEGAVTNLGTFVSMMGIDLALGSIIGLGIQMGVAAEAIQLAAVLSFPKTPWSMTNPLIHEPDQFNDLTKRSYISRCHFDSNLFSEPLATMNLLWDYEHEKEKIRDSWCYSNCLAKSRVQRLYGSCNTLRRRVSDFFEIDDKLLKLQEPPRTMPHAKLNVLRVLQVWVFYDSLIECKPNAISGIVQGKIYDLSLGQKSPQITMQHLDQVLCRKRHPCEIVCPQRTEKSGSYRLLDGHDSKLEELQMRFLSYGAEKGLQVLTYDDNSGILFYVENSLWISSEFVSPRDYLQKVSDVVFIALESSTGRRRGVGERACGQWKIKKVFTSGQHPSGNIGFWRCSVAPSHASAPRKRLCGYLESHGDIRGLLFTLKPNTKKKLQRFTATTYGVAQAVSDLDLSDLLGAADVKCNAPMSHNSAQILRFQIVPNKSLAQGSLPPHGSSWERPLLPDCVPEGARLLSVNASSRRREHLVRLQSIVDENSTTEVLASHIDVYLDPAKTKLSNRWLRMNTDKAVFVNENCVPASALPVRGEQTLYCVASNTLEVRGGGLRVEGLTLLPPGRLFLLLARLSFGLFKTGNVLDNTLVAKCISWLQQEESHPLEEMKHSWTDLVNSAVLFHQDAVVLGEELVCSPDFARRLAELFDEVDGYKAPFWDIESNPFTRENLTNWKRIYAQSKMVRSDSALSTGAEFRSSGTISYEPSSKQEGVSVHGRQTKKRNERKSDQQILPDVPRRNGLGGGLSQPSKNVQKRISSPKPQEQSRDTRNPQPVHLEDAVRSTTSRKASHQSDLLARPSCNLNSGFAPECTYRYPPESRKNEDRELIQIVPHTSSVLQADTVLKLERFPASTLELCRRLFTTTLSPGQSVCVYEFPSTNILSLIVDQVRTTLGMSVRQPMNIEDDSEWLLFAVRTNDSRAFYYARFQNQGLCLIPTATRTAALPMWMKNEDSQRPLQVDEALDCVPPFFRDGIRKVMSIVSVKGKKGTKVPVLVFESIELALRMEAAFWLDRQFQDELHWYEMGNVPTMIQNLVNACK